MDRQLRRNVVIWWMLAVLVASVAAIGSPSGAASSELNYSFQGWFMKGREGQVIVPTPNGDVSPGQLPAPPNAPDGTYLVQSTGGSAGSDGGDAAWTAFQWQMFSFADQLVTSFKLVLHKSPNARGDAGTPQLRACSAVVPWASSDGVNAWADRPVVDCSRAIAPKISGTKYTFELAPFAQKWVDREGYGVVILPGDAENPGATVTPFQLSIAGYNNPDPESRPVATIATQAPPTTTGPGPLPTTPPDTFAPPIFTDPGPVFTPDPTPIFTPDPTPIDSGPATDPGGFVAGPPPVVFQPIAATEPGANLALFLLLPVLAGAIWSTGTALGPAGEPVGSRKGGLAALLDARASDNNN